MITIWVEWSLWRALVYKSTKKSWHGQTPPPFFLAMPGFWELLSQQSLPKCLVYHLFAPQLSVMMENPLLPLSAIVSICPTSQRSYVQLLIFSQMLLCRWSFPQNLCLISQCLSVEPAISFVIGTSHCCAGLPQRALPFLMIFLCSIFCIYV